MEYKGKTLEKYSDIIDYALKLKGKAREEFVKAYRESGNYALQNIKYISEYYNIDKQKEIMRVFQGL